MSLPPYQNQEKARRHRCPHLCLSNIEAPRLNEKMHKNFGFFARGTVQSEEISPRKPWAGSGNQAPGALFFLVRGTGKKIDLARWL
jgi:hypothetical protein